MSSAPTRPLFGHLRRLTDERGLFEHCNGDQPRRELGYCTDDVARALVLATWVGEELADLCEVYVRYVVAAVAPDGQCHNRMNLDGEWTDLASRGDSWGRAVWGLGTYLTGTDARPDAEAALERLLTQRSPFVHATAYAALGAAPWVESLAPARAFVADAAELLVASGAASPAVPGWPLPEPRLTYDNALFPHALLAVGRALGRPDLVARGLDQLTFLVDLQRVDGHLSVVPVGGWGPGDRPPGFDQQPIEVASLAAAGATAFDVTGDSRWLGLVDAAAGWFLGENDVGIAMVDDDTGAGYDGLTATGRNLNRGAESTLAALSTLWLAYTEGETPCQPRSSSTLTRTSGPTQDV